MTSRADLVEKYARLERDTVRGALLPASEVYRQFVQDLSVIQANDNAQLAVDSEMAAQMCGVTSKTMSNWLSDDSKKPRDRRRFPDAWKTSEGKGGKWSITSADIAAYQQRRREEVA